MYRSPLRCLQIAAVALALTGALACSAGRGPRPGAAPTSASAPDRNAAAQTAAAMVGVPYRYRGSSPDGFDCSGLVVYSYSEAGVSGLPHSAAGLESLTRPLPLKEIEPGDLLFFRLAGPKTSHVGIYVGGRSFVHAPSKGKRVERVSFDHVYWAPRIGRAGRLGR